MIDNQLLIGIVLIAAGVAIGLLAYALVLNRREAAQLLEAEVTSPSGMAGDAEAEEEEEREAQAEPDHVQAEMAGDDMSDTLEIEGDEELAQEPTMTGDERTTAEPRPISPAMLEDEAVDEALAPPSGGRLAVATFMRDSKTGKLALLVGDREYTDPWMLKGTNDWVTVEQASKDLASWLSEAQPPEPGTTSRGKKALPQAKSLVDEVNEILERKLVESGLTQRGVRLSEDREGSVRVYIGIQSYMMNEIPDTEIREIIRQAVAEWEGRK